MNQIEFYYEQHHLYCCYNLCCIRDLRCFYCAKIHGANQKADMDYIGSFFQYHHGYCVLFYSQEVKKKENQHSHFSHDCADKYA